MPVQTPLAGESLERAKHVLGLSTRLGDGSSLLTPENLEWLGFSTTVVDATLNLFVIYDMCLVNFLLYILHAL